jgi:uncharacterized protein YndB with AHSA1/START domain
MSTHNFQFELNERSYAVQVTPFEQESDLSYRVTYNDSSSLIFTPGSKGGYDISGNGSVDLTPELKKKLMECVENVKQHPAGSMTLDTTVSIDINRDPDTVWKTLTTPELVKKYLFGANVSSEWKEGSPITYEGTYKLQSYRDKGIILKIEPGHILKSTYWSPMSGKEDRPENYNVVTYTLNTHEGFTRLTLNQDNILSPEEKEHVTKNWEQVLQGLKQVAESL